MKIDDIIRCETSLHIDGRQAEDSIEAMVSFLGVHSPVEDLEEAYMIIEDLTNALKRAALLAERLERRLSDE